MRTKALARPKLGAFAVGLFSGFGLLLAALGTFGVISFTIAQRRREMGVRMALGATAPAVVALVLRRALWMALAGECIGVVAALMLDAALRSRLTALTGPQPLLYLGVALVLVVAASTAALLPAWRASSIDPAEVMRATCSRGDTIQNCALRKYVWCPRNSDRLGSMAGAEEMARAELEALEERGLLRSLEPMRTRPGAEIELRAGERLINFSSNDYLGLAGDARIAQALAEGARAWGAGAGPVASCAAISFPSTSSKGSSRSSRAVKPRCCSPAGTLRTAGSFRRSPGRRT